MDWNIDSRQLTLEDVAAILEGERVRLQVSPEGREALLRSRAVIEDVLESGATVYGVNTGFGRLASERIDAADLVQLQINLLRSHACGIGKPLPRDLVRTVLLLRIRALVQGYSGVRSKLIDTMVRLFNAGIVAVVPEQGSVGASGDLAPLAHLALPLIGEGQVEYRGERMPAAAALKRARIRALTLAAKEGLALINGTQVSTALTAAALVCAERVAKTADIACALTLDSYKGTAQAYDAKIQQIRGQHGQQLVARNLKRLLRGSGILKSHPGCGRVQDSYSLRCAPQVHGTCRDQLREARRVVEIEMNAVTDNPLVFAKTREVISGGNFHAAPVAHAADRIAAATTDLAAMSERRIEYLVNPDLSELDRPFLSEEAGLSSGFMIPHVAAASLVSECKSLSFPAAVDSIPTSANKEDHVSMGPIAARKALAVANNAAGVVAIELLAACQALDFEKRYRSSKPLDAVYRWIRRRIPHLGADRSMSEEIEQTSGFVRDGSILELAEKHGAKVD